MKTRKTLLPVLLLAAFFSCENDDNTSIPAMDGLSLYWDHEVFDEGGRTLRFEATATNEYDHDYDLEFSTAVEGKSIDVKLVKSVDKGKCPFFPSAVVGGNPTRCSASGMFYLSDKNLGNGVYSLKISTPSFEVTSELTVTDEKVTLKIPSNEYVKSSIENVYPIPKSLLFGSVAYQGSGNTNDAKNFLDRLVSLGVVKTVVPVHPYRHLSVDQNGLPAESHWEPDNHTIGFLYKMNSTDFKTVFEESKNYFNQTNLNIYLYSSNGDQGFLSKTEGITVVYAK